MPSLAATGKQKQRHRQAGVQVASGTLQNLDSFFWFGSQRGSLHARGPAASHRVQARDGLRLLEGSVPELPGQLTSSCWITGGLCRGSGSASQVLCWGDTSSFTITSKNPNQCCIVKYITRSSFWRNIPMSIKSQAVRSSFKFKQSVYEQITHQLLRSDWYMTWHPNTTLHHWFLHCIRLFKAESTHKCWFSISAKPQKLKPPLFLITTVCWCSGWV